MKRLRTRRAVLGLLLLLGILIPGSRTADVDAEADDMVKRIEEESKKVEDQSNTMVSEIEAKGKNIEGAIQEETFEEASKHVDDIMDKREKEVDDKANFAEMLENQADKRVEEIGKKIEETSNHGHGISRKRRASAVIIKTSSGTKTSPSGTHGAKRRMTVSYPVELPDEETAGQQIEDVMKEGEHQVKHAYEEKEKEEENTVGFSNPDDFSEHANNDAEETEDARYEVGDGVDSFSQQQDYSSQDNGNKDTGKLCLRHGQTFECAHASPEFGDKDGNDSEQIDSTKQDDSDSLNVSDEEEGASVQNDDVNEAGDIMVIRQREPTVNGFSDQQEDEKEGQNTAEEHASTPEVKENNEEAILDDSALENNAFYKNDSDTDNSDDKDESELRRKQPSTGEKENDDDNEHNATIYDVDVYPENSNSSANTTKMDQNEVENGTAEGSSVVAPQTSSASGDGNDTQTESNSQQPKMSDPPVEINFLPSAELLKPDQKFLNEIEEDRALRLKQKEQKQHAKELQDLGAARLEKEFDSRWRQLGDVNDPEMLLRYPSLGKIVGKTGTNQKISTISPGEVDFLQTEYPDYTRHDSRTNKQEVELVVRDSVRGYKRKIVPKRKAKKNHLRKFLRKNGENKL